MLTVLNCTVLYLQEGTHNGRPYFKKRNNSAQEEDSFMFFDDRRWVVSDVLGNKYGYLRNGEAQSYLRDSFLIRLLQPMFKKRIMVKERKQNRPEFGWEYGKGTSWKEDENMVLEWISPEPCRTIEVRAR